MKLLLVNFFPPETSARYLLSSYLLKAYLSQHLPDPDLKVEVVDLSCLDTAERVVPLLLGRHPDLIGFSCYAWNMSLVRECLHRLKAASPVPCLLGGPEISPGMATELSGQGMGDYFCIGEGEEWLLTLMQRLLSRQGRRDGVEEVSSGKSGELMRQPPVDLLKVPPVYLSGALDTRLYRYQQAFLETQRGCRNRCAYCLYHKNLPGIAYLPLPRVLDEIDHLVLRERIRALRILDPVFTSDLARAKEVVRHMIRLKEQQGAVLPWTYWEFTMDSVDREFLSLTSGLRYGAAICNADVTEPVDRPQLYTDMLRNYTVINCVGLQSLNPAAQRATGRRHLSPGQVQEFLSLAREMNIALKLDLMLGLPGEDYDSYFRGLSMLLPYFAGTDHVLNIHRVMLLPGTLLEKRAHDLGLVRKREHGHLVLATPDFPRKDLEHAARLTAVLFRVFNSPFRSRFLEAMEREGLIPLLERLLAGAIQEQGRHCHALGKETPVDDVYWNDRIFSDIPSYWVDKALLPGRKAA